MIKLPVLVALSSVVLAAATSDATAAEKIRLLVVDGQNNHNWKATTPVLVKQFEASGRFTVDVATSPPRRQDMSEFRPRFGNYDVVVSNYNGDPWSDDARDDFEQYVRGGGGFVSIHAANNSFPDWSEYNKMIGLGGWGGRNEKWGPYVYYQDDELVRDETAGSGGHHGPQHEFQVKTQNDAHPIVRDLPRVWLHAKDELYARLRGPARQMDVLATAYAGPDRGGTSRDEPMLMTLRYGKGRVFHTTLGHADYSMKCVGFIVTTLRGAEWAATGQVTIPVPDDFPTAEASSSRGD